MEKIEDLFKKFLSKLSNEHKQKVEDAMSSFEDAQNEYESVVLSHYAQNELFKPGRTINNDREGEEEFEKDLDGFMNLIMHTIKSGGINILKTYGIDPIFHTKDGIKKLSAHDQLESYANAFAEWHGDELKTPLAKMCARLLEEECRKYMAKQQNLLSERQDSLSP